MTARAGSDDRRPDAAGVTTVEPAAMGEAEPFLIAYRTGPKPPLRLVPATRERDWIEATSDRFANRCLPLLMANQAGWYILNSHALTVTWDGGRSKRALRIDYRSGRPPYPASSHFGHGILTWRLPYLFRTPPGWNLLARGPANWPKAGIAPLEGLVEADWAVATFTMNWKLTAIGTPVSFEVDEPICLLVPQRRGELEAFAPQVREIASDPELHTAYAAWTESRGRFLADLQGRQPEAVRQAWQRDYFQGAAPDGTRAPAHQTKLRLRPFAGADEPDQSPGDETDPLPRG
jgi:hypothetical protein